MLVLKRKVGEKAMVGPDIEVQVLAVEGDTIKLGFVAPPHVPIMREELFAAIRNENLEASRPGVTPDDLKRLLEHNRKPK